MTENRIVLKLEDLSLYILKDGKETPILKNIQSGNPRAGALGHRRCVRSR